MRQNDRHSAATETRSGTALLQIMIMSVSFSLI